jgi:hypothetical protein
MERSFLIQLERRCQSILRIGGQSNRPSHSYSALPVTKPVFKNDRNLANRGDAVGGGDEGKRLRAARKSRKRNRTLLPECLDEWVEDSNSVRVVDSFVDALDLADLGFEGVEPCGDRPSCVPPLGSS